MLKRRASFLSLCYILLCAALFFLSACGDAGTKRANSNNSSSDNTTATRPQTETHASPTATAGAQGSVPVAAMAILDDYQRDSSAADHKYKGQTVVIWGEVAVTGKSKAGVPFVSFQRPGVASPAGTMVVCNLTLDQDAAVRALQKGHKVRLSGRVQGTLTGNVLLDNCVLQP